MATSDSRRYAAERGSAIPTPPTTLHTRTAYTPNRRHGSASSATYPPTRPRQSRLMLPAISPAPRRQSGSAHRTAPGRYAYLRCPCHVRCHRAPVPPATAPARPPVGSGASGSVRSTPGSCGAGAVGWETPGISTRRHVSGSARCGASRRPPACNGSRRHTELCRISFESADIYSGRGTTACSESGRSSNGMRRRVRAERARANDLEAEPSTVHTKLTVLGQERLAQFLGRIHGKRILAIHSDVPDHVDHPFSSGRGVRPRAR